MKRALAAAVFAMALILPASVAAAVPLATFTIAPASPTNAATLSYTVTFSEPVTGLTASDFTRTGTATGCVVGAPTGSGPYTVALTGCSAGTVILALNANSVSTADNTGPAAVVTAATVTIDRTAPTATVTPPASPTNATTLSYTVAFSEPVSGLAASDFARTGTATGCVVGAPTGPGPYTVAVTGCSVGTVILALAANSVTDTAGNTGPAAIVTAATVTIERTAPTATLTAPASPTNAATLSYTLTFSEPITGLAASDFTRTGTATGCVVGAPTGSGPYTVALTGCSDGTVILALAANSVTDIAGNAGPAAVVTAATVTIDRVPTATLTAPASPTNAATLSYTVTFSESVTGLAASDFTVTGTATGCVVGAPAGSGGSYTVVVTGCSEGTVILAMAANSVTDATAHTGPVAIVTAATVTIDRTAPTASSLAVKPWTGAALSGSSIPLLLTWSAGDNAGGSGVARYELSQSTNGGAWTVVSTSLTSNSAAVTAASSGTVLYEVRAIDAAGNASAWATGITLSPRLTQQSSSSVKYTGTWTQRSSSSFSGGSIKYSKTAGRSASVKFTGRSIALVTTTAPSRGKVKIYVNGKYLTTVDLYGSSTQYRVLAWQKTWSSSGTRTVKLVVAGTSGRPRVDLDAFVIVK